MKSIVASASEFIMDATNAIGASCNHARAEELIRTSGLDFTIIRPVQLVDGPTNGKAVAVPIGAETLGSLKVARSAVAAFMVEELAARKFVGQGSGSLHATQSKATIGVAFHGTAATDPADTPPRAMASHRRASPWEGQSPRNGTSCWRDT